MEIKKTKRLIKPILLPFWWLYVAVTGVIAFTLGLAGIAAGLYVGGWMMLLGGLADVINLFKSYDPVTASDVAIAIGKIIFAIPAGIAISSVGLSPAAKIIMSWDKKPWFAVEEDREFESKRRSLGYDD